MIEGSQLDDYGHFNDIDLLMQETHDFDRTIGAIYEWAAKDGETLVVVLQTMRLVDLRWLMEIWQKAESYVSSLPVVIAV